jgi:DNA (cytosine-5)-methyltransferase 1
MAESGWLTRSIEQAHPFTLDFPGKIRNPAVKAAFLGILDDVETKRADAFTYLIALLYGLRQAHARDVSLLISLQSMPTALDVVEIVARLEALFSTNFDEAGAARLPVLALYAIYQCLTGHYRYEGKRLSPLKSHTASDERSRTYGDIEVLDGDGNPFEAVEVKYDRPIDRGMLTIAAQKIAGSGLRRYLLLTTHDPNISDDGVLHLAQAIRARDDCEVIVNGVLPTLKYYLRLLDTPQAFLKAFHEVLEADFTQNTDIKRSHVERWQSLLQD